MCYIATTPLCLCEAAVPEHCISWVAKQITILCSPTAGTLPADFALIAPATDPFQQSFQHLESQGQPQQGAADKQLQPLQTAVQAALQDILCVRGGGPPEYTIWSGVGCHSSCLPTADMAIASSRVVMVYDLRAFSVCASNRLDVAHLIKEYLTKEYVSSLCRQCAVV